MGNAQLELLERTGHYISVPKGISMRPMLRGGQDAVVIEKLAVRPKRYDLVMYIRGREQGVLHRVIREKAGQFIICGDNCWQLEYVKPEQIRGIVTEYCRKGKWHGVDWLPYRLYVHLWVDLLFIRRPVFYIRDRIRRKLKR